MPWRRRSRPVQHGLPLPRRHPIASAPWSKFSRGCWTLDYDTISASICYVLIYSVYTPSLLCMMYVLSTPKYSSKYCMWENVLYVCTLVQPVEPSPLLLVVVHTLLLCQMSAMIQQEPYAGAPPQHSTLNNQEEHSSTRTTLNTQHPAPAPAQCW